MTALTALWLPILLSAVAVFVASSIIHMATRWHDSDYGPLPDEGGVSEALRRFAVPPGDYVLPRASSNAEMGSPEFVARMKAGPVMMLTVMENQPMAIGRSLVMWFVFSLVVGVLAGYVAGLSLPPGTEYRLVFRLVSATAFIAYAVALWEMSIWFYRSWLTTVKASVDGLIYALLTAGIFGWLWPA